MKTFTKNFFWKYIVRSKLRWILIVLYFAFGGAVLQASITCLALWMAIILIDTADRFRNGLRGEA